MAYSIVQVIAESLIRQGHTESAAWEIARSITKVVR